MWLMGTGKMFELLDKFSNRKTCKKADVEE
jgi:hypothetical protein